MGPEKERNLSGPICQRNELGGGREFFKKEAEILNSIFLWRKNVPQWMESGYAAQNQHKDIKYRSILLGPLSSGHRPLPLSVIKTYSRAHIASLSPLPPPL